MNPCHRKGDEQMMIGTEKRLIWTVTVIIFGIWIGNLFATDGTQALTLSGALSQVKLFDGLTDAERDSLKTAATLRRSTEGERIIQQGQILDKMFVILDGEGEVWVNGKYLLTLSGQFLVGEIEFLDTLPASADVILVKESDFIELDNAAFGRLVEKQPRLGYVLMREIAKIEGKRLRDTDSK
jgi:CRP/FNR family cyclic AMP-dependent transcriptional regulator